MPNQPATPTHPIRVEETLWREYGELTRAAGSNRTATIVAFIRWYCRRAGSELPRRPEEAE